MSIQTKLEPYCEKCDAFKPEKTTLYSIKGPETIIVTCEHAGECSARCAYLKEQIEEDVKRKFDDTTRFKLADYARVDKMIEKLFDALTSGLPCFGREQRIDWIISKFNRMQSTIAKLKAAVAILGGLIVGNVLAWVIGLFI